MQYLDNYSLKKGLLYDFSSGIFKNQDLFIEKGKLSFQYEKENNLTTHINVEGCVVVPSFVDLRMHLNLPGTGGVENLEMTLSRATRGGYSNVLLMPNTAPMIDSPASARLIQERAKSINGVEVLVAGCLTVQSKGEALSPMGSLKEAGICAVTDCPKSPQNNKIFINAVKYAKMFDLPVIEYPVTFDLHENTSAHESLQSIKMGLRGEPRISEELSVHRAIAVSRKENAKIHISSISTSSSVDLVRKAKDEGIRITADVTANHLLFNEDAINQFDTNAKMQPYLKEEHDRQSLIDGIIDGTIDAITSAHEAWPIHLKGVEFDRAPAGSMGLETAFHASYLALSEKVKNPIPLLVDKFAIQPRKILGLELPQLKNNKICSFNVISTGQKWVFCKDSAINGNTINSPVFNSEFTTSIKLSCINGKTYADVLKN